MNPKRISFWEREEAYLNVLFWFKTFSDDNDFREFLVPCCLHVDVFHKLKLLLIKKNPKKKDQKTHIASHHLLFFVQG